MSQSIMNIKYDFFNNIRAHKMVYNEGYNK